MQRKSNGQFKKDNRLTQWFIGWTFVVAMFFIGIAGSKAMYQKVIHSVGTVVNVQNAQAEDNAIIEQFHKPTLWDKIGSAAENYKISAYQLYRTAQCESRFNPGQSQVIKNGKRENSWGIFQISLDFHPEITRAQAMDEDFAIEWAAKNFNKVIWYAYNKRLDICN